MSYSPSSSRVRSLWQSFVKSSTGSRNATEHKIRAATAKADEAAKAGIARDIQEKSFRTLRAQWQSLLLKESLTDADWSDITEAEKDAVTTILGELPDDDQDPFPSSSSASPQMPPPNPIPYPHPLAPSFSNSTRSTNISSASSYAVVSPNELYSEDDGDLFMVSLLRFRLFLRVATHANSFSTRPLPTTPRTKTRSGSNPSTFTPVVMARTGGAAASP